MNFWSSSKLFADCLVIAAWWATLVLALLFSIASSLRFCAYIRLGGAVVGWSEWVLLAIGAAVSTVAFALMARLAERWVFG